MIFFSKNEIRRAWNKTRSRGESTCITPSVIVPQVTQREIVRIIKFEQRPVPGKDIRSQLMPNKMPESETRKVLMLADLLEKTLMLDPAKRLRPSEALKHPFCDLSRK